MRSKNLKDRLKRMGKVDQGTITWLPSRSQMDVFATGFQLSSKVNDIVSTIDSPSWSWQLHLLTYHRDSPSAQEPDLSRPTGSCRMAEVSAHLETNGFERGGACSVQCGFTARSMHSWMMPASERVGGSSSWLSPNPQHVRMRSLELPAAFLGNKSLTKPNHG